MEPQEYSRNTIEYKDPGRYIQILVKLYSCGSLFGVPSRVPLFVWGSIRLHWDSPALCRDNISVLPDLTGYFVSRAKDYLSFEGICEFQN